MEMVTLTEAAVSRIRDLAEGVGEKVLRFSTEVAGCSGRKYVLEWADKPGSHDSKVEKDGVSLFIDPLSVMYVLGTEIDWQEDQLERKFVFRNPMELGRCGCGESFHV